MKRVFVFFAVLLAAAAAFMGCAAKSVDAKTGGKLLVCTSIYPIYDFAMKIGGDCVRVENIVPYGVEPHNWEPGANDIIKLQKADVFIYNGAGMEHWVEDLLEALDNDGLIVVNASAGLELIDSGSGTDPHTWLSPLNAKQQCAAIRDALCEAGSKNREYYEANYKKYAAEFELLDGQYRSAIAALPNRNIVVSHEAFGYICAEYGLTQVAVEGLAPDSEPDPARMAEIIDFVKENGVSVIFFEETASSAVAETIASATGAAVDVLYPLDLLTDSQLKAGEDYFSIMRANLKAIENGLK